MTKSARPFLPKQIEALQKAQFPTNTLEILNRYVEIEFRERTPENRPLNETQIITLQIKGVSRQDRDCNTSISFILYQGHVLLDKAQYTVHFQPTRLDLHINHHSWCLWGFDLESDQFPKIDELGNYDLEIECVTLL